MNKNLIQIPTCGRGARLGQDVGNTLNPKPNLKGIMYCSISSKFLQNNSHSPRTFPHLRPKDPYFLTLRDNRRLQFSCLSLQVGGGRGRIGVVR
jgi:hypothetical protein